MANSVGAKKIARNTLLLYTRMAVLLIVGLYTSRVVLAALGEDDYGIYNVVGGVVAMFSIVSGAMSSAISRFITFELGRGGERLHVIFRCAILVQLALAVIIVAVGEPAGLWFIGEEMTISPDRVTAARIVLQFSLITFVINLLSVPYNALIIAHEQMGAFAAVGLFEGLAKLGVAFLIADAPMDRLVWYSLLMCVVALLVRIAYTVYCRRHFAECRRQTSVDAESRCGDFSGHHRHSGMDAGILREMFGFAGWNFIGVSAGVLKDQGGSILVNLYSPSPAVNAGRGIAMQLSGAVQSFVTNFMTAVNPQITKSYASGDHGYMHMLVRKSAKFSYFLILFLALPLILETDWLLGLWLRDIPEYAPMFVRLMLVLVLSDSLSNPLITMQLATGDIKRYQIVVGGILLLNVPVSWALLSLGFGVEWVVVVAIGLSQAAMFARLALLRGMAGLNVGMWFREVWLRVVCVTACACVPAVLLRMFGGQIHQLAMVLTAMLSVAFAAWFVGCTAEERKMIVSGVKSGVGQSRNTERGLASFARYPLRVWAAVNKDSEILAESSSGGVFYPLALRFISEGGVVCAAVWDDDFRGVHHDFANDAEGVRKMMRSKYMQSSLGGCFLKVRQLLDSGRNVMFVGTPCQVKSLRKFIYKDTFKNAANAAVSRPSAGCAQGELLFVEILCHGTPLVRSWREYLCSQLSAVGAVSAVGVNFRDKSISGWKKYCVTIDYQMPDGSLRRISQPYAEVPFMRDFLADRNLRNDCHKCGSRNGRSGADISLGDFWGVDKLLPDVYNSQGVSVVSAYTESGLRLLDSMSAELSFTEISMETFGHSLKYNGGYGK